MVKNNLVTQSLRTNPMTMHDVPGSNFYPKSLTFVVSILELVQKKIIAVDIAKRLNMNKSHVSYYIKKLRELGFIKQVARDTFSVLEVTQPGKNFLDQYNKANPSIPICRAENIQFKASIIKMPIIPVDWKKIQMNNWTQFTSRIDSVKVRLNIGKEPTIELIPSPIDGDDPFELYITLVCECMNVIHNLYDKIGLVVGNLELSSRGEWLVYDPIARSFCKTNGQVSYEGIGKVNASGPSHIGELEFHDPRMLLGYMLMPMRLKNIETKLDIFFEKQNK